MHGDDVRVLSSLHLKEKMMSDSLHTSGEWK